MQAYSTNMATMYSCLELGKSFVWCQPWSKLSNLRQLLLDLNSHYSGLVLILVEVSARRNVLVARLRERNYQNINQYLEYYDQKYQPLSSTTFSDSATCVISGEASFEEQYEDFLIALDLILN